MRQTKYRRRWSRHMVVVVAVAISFIGVLDNRSATAAPVQLFVSNLATGNVLSFNSDTGGFIRNLVSSGAGEGVVCLPVAGGGCTLFVSNNGSSITAYAINALTSAPLGTFAGPYTGVTTFAALSLSASPTPTLYAADYGTSNIFAIPITAAPPGVLPTAGPPGFTTTSASHDVAVGNGSVYAARFSPTTNVFAAADNPASTLLFSTFITNGDNGLTAPAGMAVDTTGNLWVSNFSSTNPGVYEYSSTGAFITEVISPLFVAPFGLARGPDGNIYVADFFGNRVEEIDLSAGNSVTAFITNPATCPSSPECLSHPKYLTFSNISAVPEPGSLVLILTSLLAAMSLRASRPSPSR